MSALRFSAVTASLAALLVAVAACEDTLTQDRRLVIEGTGVVRGFAFLDVDGSGSAGDVDEPAQGIRLRLMPARGGGAVRTEATDGQGVFQMTEVPVGEFRLEVDPESVPDSVEVFGLDTVPFKLTAGLTIDRNFRVSFPTFSLAEVRELEPGRRVFTKGIVLNARVPFGDGVMHLREGEVHLRSTAVERTSVLPQDSVRVSGRTAVDAGQPILTDVRVFLLQSQAVALIPFELSTAEATTASDGTRDAALVRIQNAVIQDTVRVGDDLIVTADDGSGPVDVVLRSFISWNWSAFRPQEVELSRADGLLVPMLEGDGTIRWRLTPRGGADVSLEDVEDEDDADADAATEPSPAMFAGQR